jgi:hypothetical protein
MVKRKVVNNSNKGAILNDVTIINYLYIIVIQIFPALACVYIFDKIFTNKKKDKVEYDNIPTYQILFEVMIHYWSIYILYYIVKDLLKETPSPFDNIFDSGFKNTTITETRNSTIFSSVFMMFQASQKEKIKVLKDRLIG